jgi:hypothetical protein
MTGEITVTDTRIFDREAQEGIKQKYFYVHQVPGKRKNII